MIAQPSARPSHAVDLPNGTSKWPAQGEWRYEDYLRLPDDGRRYEIIEGVLYVANAPSYAHQLAVYKLARYLGDFVEVNRLGVVLGAPFEVHLSELSRPVQPDVLFLRNDQKPSEDAQIFVGAPTLIVEVISPSSIRVDRKVKFDLYEATGVAEFWLVDPKTRSIEIYTLSNGEYALVGQFTGDEVVKSNVLDGLDLKVSAIF